MDETNLEQANEAVTGLEQLTNTDQPINEHNPEEEYARSKGWRPKDEWDSDKGEWIDAAEFNRRGPLFDTIGKLKDEIREYKKSSDALVEHNKRLQEHAQKSEERARQKVLEELEERRKEAVQDGDLDLFNEIDQEIKEKTREPEPEPDNAIPESILKWKESNDWFDKDEAMTSYMIHEQNKYLGQGLSVPDALERATERVKTEFSHKFDNPNKTKPSMVMGQQDSGGKKTYSVNDLPAEYRPVFNAISRKAGIGINEYIQQLKELGAM